MKRDTLFDGKFTYLDGVKICLLIVTAFSTWNVVDIMTPDSSWAWVRKLAAVLVVEGAFIGFEFATSDAKNKRQVQFATIGFFCSLFVISIFAGLSGLLEFGGADLIGQYAGSWLGITWLVADAIKAFALLILVLWIAALATIYRFYALNDPDKRAELQDIELEETMRTEEAKAKAIALDQARPTVASHRAIANIKDRYTDEIGKEQMEVLLQDVSADLRKQYAVKQSPPPPSVPEIAVHPEVGFVPRDPAYQQTAEEIEEQRLLDSIKEDRPAKGTDFQG